MASNPPVPNAEMSGTAPAQPERIPTINDLRVKTCYICMEEERSDGPKTTPPRAWTHPCNCTLVAHTDCLLKWIQSSQATSSRAPNALKCPQCGTIYQLSSKEPRLLKVLNTGNRILKRCGTYFTLVGVAAAIGVAGTSIYICLTAYGAYALERFIGKEMFDIILTDDPTNWPWTAYFNLPLIPTALILSRFTPSSFSTPSGSSFASLVVPFLLIWPTSQPVGEPARRLVEYWTRPENARRLTEVFVFGGNRPGMRMWPPPPMLFGMFGVPVIRALYSRLYAGLYKRILGAPLQRRTNRQANANAGAGRNAEEAVEAAEGPLVIRIVQRAGEAPANPRPAGQDGPVEDEDPNAANIQAAENILVMDTASLGRRVGGALLVPAISNFMGRLLLRLSKHSILLRGILGVSLPLSNNASSGVGSWLVGNYTGPGSFSPQDPRRVGRALPSDAYSQGRSSSLTEPEPDVPYPPLSWTKLFLFSSLSANASAADAHWKQMSIVQRSTVSLKLVLDAIIGGSRMWVESDPVWWRNSLGFALFCAVKDALHLLHLHLKKKELESRKVVNRDFSGVDISSLDLLPSFLKPREENVEASNHHVGTQSIPQTDEKSS